MASLTASFNSSKLKLAHINIRSCRNKEVEISLFLKENDIDTLSLNETWLKSNFKLDIPNYTIARRDRLRRQGGGVAILVRNDIKFDIIDPCSTLNTAITILLKIHKTLLAFQQFIFIQHPLSTPLYLTTSKKQRII